MNLKLGQDYYYWNKSVYEKKGSKKFCKLLSISKDGGFARILRYDLDVNAIQFIEIKRLREIPLVRVVKTNFSQIDLEF